MISRDPNFSEVFEILAAQTGPEFLDGTADFVLPENTLDSAGSAELDIGLSDVVAASAGPKLYGVKSEPGDKTVGQAHPGGGAKLDFGSNDKELGKVETIVEQHKRNQDIALKMPKGKVASLVGKLAKLADAMDEAGFSKEADQLEATMNILSKAAEAAEMSFSPQEAAEAGPSEPGRTHNFAPAEIAAQNPKQKIRQMNQKAVDLVNQHFRAAGLVPISENLLMRTLAEMGVSGYRTWGELFNQIGERAPNYVAQRAKAVSDWEQAQQTAGSQGRGAAENLAAAEKNYSTRI